MPLPFTRFQHPDQRTNQIVQDLYDKLAAINVEGSSTANTAASSEAQIVTIQGQVSSLSSQVTSLAPIKTQAAVVPRVLTSLPSSNPNITDPPLRDGSLVEYSPFGGSGVIYRYNINVLLWEYLTGCLACNQADLAPLTSVIGSSDEGLLVYVKDFWHQLRWNGSAWEWAPGDNGSGYIQTFLIDPLPTTGWHLCDGTGVSYLNANGTKSNITLPDMTSAFNKAAYLKMGPVATGTIIAASAPTLVMDSYTPAGTNNAPALTMNSYTPAGTFTGSSATTSAVSAGTVAAHVGLVTVVTAGVVSVQAFNGAGDLSHTALGTHTHTLTATGTFSGTPATLTGTVAAPVFTGTPTVLTGTISTTGEPRNLVLRPWFRL